MAQVVLTREQLDTLLQAERILHDTLPQIDDLEKCGGKCDILRRDAQATSEQIRLMRDLFGRMTPATPSQ